MTRILSITVLFTLFACSSKEVSTGVMVDLFDTEAYLNELYPSSDNINHIIKIVSYDGDRERIEDKNYDLDQDLSILKNANINNPSWQDKYTVDTIRTSDTSYDIDYQSVDEKLRIKSLKTSIENDQVIRFEIYEERDALISHSTKKIIFQRDIGYTISTTNANLISERTDIDIDVRFQ